MRARAQKEIAFSHFMCCVQLTLRRMACLSLTTIADGRPQVYKDANHKPEMAIALTDFEALCGFVTHAELVRALESTPELAACVGAEPAAALQAAGEGGGARRAALREAFTSLMLCDADTVCS